MTRNRFFSTALLGLISLLPGASAWADSVTVIDQYTDPFYLEAGTASGSMTMATTGVQTGLGGAIGGTRNVTLVETNARIGTDAIVSTDNPHNLYFDTGGVANGSSNGMLTLSYGSYASTNSYLNLNLTGSNAFNIALVRGDFSNSSNTETLTIQVRSGAGSGSDITQSVTLAFAGVDGANESVPFSAFTGINFADVDGIQTVFQATNGSPDTQFGVFSAVPEPSTLAMLLPLTAAGAWVLRRRTVARQAEA